MSTGGITKKAPPRGHAAPVTASTAPATVSVVIPTYNRAHCIADTVRSVLSQTVRPHEVIVVDDGSTDDTAGALRPFGANVRYLPKTNGGVSSARNAGMRAATGDVIAFLDADDVWLPQKLEIQLAFHAARPDAGWSVTNHVTTDLASRPLPGSQGFARDFPVFRAGGGDADAHFAGALEPLSLHAGGATHRGYAGDAYRLLFHGNFVFPSGAMVQRAVLERAGDFDETMRVAEDTEYFHRVAHQAPVVIVMTPLFHWRRGQANTLLTSAQGRALIGNALTSLDRALALTSSPDAGLRQLHAAARRTLLRRLAWGELTDLHGRDARRALAEARRWGAGWSARDVGIWAASWLPPAMLTTAANVKRWARGAPNGGTA